MDSQIEIRTGKQKQMNTITSLVEIGSHGGIRDTTR